MIQSTASKNRKWDSKQLCLTPVLTLILSVRVPSCDCTLGVDATTQEGVHINSAHITTATDCFAIAVDEFAGSTAEDYKTHIEDSINNLATLKNNRSHRN